MAVKIVYFLALSLALAAGQRPGFAGSRPIGYPEVIKTTTEGLGNRFGEDDGTTQRLPIEANGDRDLVDRLSKLPVDKQPFWFINWQAYEEQRKKPQTYPQKPNVFVGQPTTNNQGLNNPQNSFPNQGNNLQPNQPTQSNPNFQPVNNQGFQNPQSNQGLNSQNVGAQSNRPGQFNSQMGNANPTNPGFNGFQAPPSFNQGFNPMNNRMPLTKPGNAGFNNIPGNNGFTNRPGGFNSQNYPSFNTGKSTDQPGFVNTQQRNQNFNGMQSDEPFSTDTEKIPTNTDSTILVEPSESTALPKILSTPKVLDTNTKTLSGL